MQDFQIEGALTMLENFLDVEGIVTHSHNAMTSGRAGGGEWKFGPPHNLLCPDWLCIKARHC